VIFIKALSISTAYFDLDRNGFAERVGWVAPREGLLALDVNRNGRIDNGTELFGTATQNGFEVLARYDDNRDGRIDASDSVWSNLLIWRLRAGNTIWAVGDYTRVNGDAAEVVVVPFTSYQINTRFVLNCENDNEGKEKWSEAA
jgi:hypothetical protein